MIVPYGSVIVLVKIETKILKMHNNQQKTNIGLKS
jgi:hypothetical protein